MKKICDKCGFDFSIIKGEYYFCPMCGTEVKRVEQAKRNCETCKNYKKDEKTGVKACSKWDCEYEEKEVENDDN